MAVTIKSAGEIEKMREAGRLLARVHEKLAKTIRPGVSTKEIDTICEELIRGYGCTPNFYTIRAIRRVCASPSMRRSCTVFLGRIGF